MYPRTSRIFCEVPTSPKRSHKRRMSIGRICSLLQYVFFAHISSPCAYPTQRHLSSYSYPLLYCTDNLISHHVLKRTTRRPLVVSRQERAIPYGYHTIHTVRDTIDTRTHPVFFRFVDVLRLVVYSNPLTKNTIPQPTSFVFDKSKHSSWKREETETRPL